MTKKETIQVLGVLHAMYPSQNNQTDEGLQIRAGIWNELFAEEPASVVMAAVKAYIANDTKGYMPGPGQIKEQIAIMTQENTLTEQEAWDIVLTALKNSTYNAGEEWEKLPDSIKRAVGSRNMLKSWASVNFSELHTVVASNFKRDYRAVVSEVRNLAKIPEAIRKIPEKTAPKQIGDGSVGRINR